MYLPIQRAIESLGSRSFLAAAIQKSRAQFIVGGGGWPAEPRQVDLVADNLLISYFGRCLCSAMPRFPSLERFVPVNLAGSSGAFLRQSRAPNVLLRKPR